MNDNPGVNSVCELFKEVLTSVEMDPITLTESNEASSRLAKEKFQAVFLDRHMPGPGGIELAGQMRASGMNRSTPIVIYSQINGVPLSAVHTTGGDTR